MLDNYIACKHDIFNADEGDLNVERQREGSKHCVRQSTSGYELADCEGSNGFTCTFLNSKCCFFLFCFCFFPQVDDLLRIKRHQTITKNIAPCCLGFRFVAIVTQVSFRSHQGCTYQGPKVIMGGGC